MGAYMSPPPVPVGLKLGYLLKVGFRETVIYPSNCNVVTHWLINKSESTV
jgi:hypothetical protein